MEHQNPFATFVDWSTGDTDPWSFFDFDAASSDAHAQGPNNLDVLDEYPLTTEMPPMQALPTQPSSDLAAEPDWSTVFEDVPDIDCSLPFSTIDTLGSNTFQHDQNDVWSFPQSTTLTQNQSLLSEFQYPEPEGMYSGLGATAQQNCLAISPELSRQPLTFDDQRNGNLDITVPQTRLSQLHNLDDGCLNLINGMQYQDPQATSRAVQVQFDLGSIGAYLNPLQNTLSHPSHATANHRTLPIRVSARTHKVDPLIDQQNANVSETMYPQRRGLPYYFPGLRTVRTRPQVRQSDEHIRLASASYRSERIEIGKGMDAGRNLLAYFDFGAVPVTRHEIVVKRGRRGKDAHLNYPNAAIVLPARMSLQAICNKFPNHVWGSMLRVFHAERWDSEQIWRALPSDCRHNTSKIRPWNYIQQAIGREIDKMCEEQFGCKRVPMKRKRDVTSCVEEEEVHQSQKIHPRINTTLDIPDLGLRRTTSNHKDTTASPDTDDASRPLVSQPRNSVDLLNSYAGLFAIDVDTTTLPEPATDTSAITSPAQFVPDESLVKMRNDIAAEMKRHVDLLMKVAAIHRVDFHTLSANEQGRLVTDLWQQRYTEWHRRMCIIYSLQIPLVMQYDPKPVLVATYCRTKQAPPRPNQAAVYREWRENATREVEASWLQVLREWTIEWTVQIKNQSSANATIEPSIAEAATAAVDVLATEGTGEDFFVGILNHDTVTNLSSEVSLGKVNDPGDEESGNDGEAAGDSLYKVKDEFEEF